MKVHVGNSAKQLACFYTKLIFRTFLAGPLLLAPCLHGAAQTSTAHITGTITDTSGAVVGSATVIAHNEQTGEDRTTVSSDAGTFVFFSLSPTQYTLHASAKGFGNIEFSKLPAKFDLMIAYLGSVGCNLFLRSITNTTTGVYQSPTTGAGTAIRQLTVGGVPTTSTTPGALGTNRFAEIDYKKSGGADSYSSLQSTLQRRFHAGLLTGAQYTFAKKLGTSSRSNEATSAQNPYDLRTEFGRGTNDIRNYVNATVLYDLPLGQGKRYSFSRPVNAVFGGFQVGGVINARTGLPIDVLITRPDLAYTSNVGSAIAGQVFSSPVLTAGVVQTTAVVNVPGGGNSRNVRRPNVVPGVSKYLGSRGQFINPAAFSVPLPGTFGNARRNDTTGPGLAQFDLTLAKGVTIFEGVRMQFKADAYNIFNHPNFGNPGANRLTQGIPSAPGNASAIQPGTPYPTGLSSTAGSSLGLLSSTVGNQVGLGTNRRL